MGIYATNYKGHRIKIEQDDEDNNFWVEIPGTDYLSQWNGYPNLTQALKEAKADIDGDRIAKNVMRLTIK